MIKSIRDNLIARLLRNFVFLMKCDNISYSQNCEDVIVDRILKKEKGFYVDVGAHHPYKKSNTYQYYLKGWSGINIDPMPECMRLFKKKRPRDTNLNIGISNQNGILKYYTFSEPAFNTTNKERADYLINNNITELIKTVDIDVIRLDEVFDKYVENKEIDLLTIDVETTELDVLESNNWEKYRPRMVVMESIISSRKEIKCINEDPAVNYLINKGYIVIAKVLNAVFLLRNEE